MGVIGEWYPRKYVDLGDKTPGRPAPGYVLSGRPLYSSRDKNWYCVWYSPSGAVSIRKLYSSVDSATIAAGAYATVLKGAFVYGGYIYFLGNNAMLRFDPTIGVGAVTTIFTLGTMTDPHVEGGVVVIYWYQDYISLCHDGSGNGYVVHIGSHALSYSGNKTCKIYLVPLSGAATTALYTGFETSSVLEVYDYFYQGGNPYVYFWTSAGYKVRADVASSPIVWVGSEKPYGSGYHRDTAGTLLQNRDNSLSWTFVETLWAVAKETGVAATTRLILVDDSFVATGNYLFYEGDTLKYTVVVGTTQNGYETWSPDIVLPHENAPGLCWRRATFLWTNAWRELRPLAWEVT